MAAPKNKKGFKGAKPVYKKNKAKPVRKDPISNEVRSQKEPSFHPVFMQPTEKYAVIIKDLFKKGFFVDAQYGTRVYANNVKEFHVDGKHDIPVVLAEVKYRNKNGDICTNKKVFRIIRYNADELVGMNSQNINIWMMPTVQVDDLIPKEVPKAKPKK